MSSGKIIGKGAEAEIRKERVFGKEVAVKDRIRKKYRIREIDHALRKNRTRVEARLLMEAKKAGVLCPIVYAVGEFEIAMEFVDGILLRNARAGIAAKKLFDAGAALAKLHSAGMVHGDYTPANIILRKRDGRACVIDFGLGAFSRDEEDRAMDLLVMKKSLGSERLFRAFASGYSSEDKKAAERALRQLDEVEKRGRYVVRAMMG